MLWLSVQEILCSTWTLSDSGFFLVFKILFIYFLEEEEEREKERETSVCGCLLRAPHQGPGLQPRQVPQLGIELVTLWFSGQHSIH